MIEPAWVFLLCQPKLTKPALPGLPCRGGQRRAEPRLGGVLRVVSDRHFALQLDRFEPYYLPNKFNGCAFLKQRSDITLGVLPEGHAVRGLRRRGGGRGGEPAGRLAEPVRP
jgi:hypothetical protein